MQTVKIDGGEIALRCDINTYEEILGRFGSIETAIRLEEDEVENLRKVRYLVTLFANEHNAYVGSSERFTETEIGRRILPGERTAVYRKIIETIQEAFAPKN
jgi:hypothetical protein